VEELKTAGDTVKKNSPPQLGLLKKYIALQSQRIATREKENTGDKGKKVIGRCKILTVSQRK